MKNKRLELKDILLPGAVINTGRIDFNDPKNAELLKLFEETAKRQQELVDLRDQEIDYDLRVTI